MIDSHVREAPFSTDLLRSQVVVDFLTPPASTHVKPFEHIHQSITVADARFALENIPAQRPGEVRRQADNPTRNV